MMEAPEVWIPLALLCVFACMADYRNSLRGLRGAEEKTQPDQLPQPKSPDLARQVQAAIDRLLIEYTEKVFCGGECRDAWMDGACIKSA